MGKWEIDCVLVHKSSNQYYISGMYQHLPWYPDCHTYVTEAPIILFRDTSIDPVFLCHFGTINAIKEGTWIEDVRTYDQERNRSVYEAIADILTDNGQKSARIGVEEDTLTISTFEKLENLLPDAEFVHASEVFNFARIVKEPEEIELLKKSVVIGEAAMKAAIEAAQVGVPESEVQRAAEIEMRKGGAVREVETMCQSGVRTSNFRAFGAEWKKIERNELVMVDLGCVYKGYGCDITRTWAVGEATPEQKKIAGDLYKAHEEILKFIKPGLRYREVIDFARKILTDAGYETSRTSFPYQHFVMHGIGLGPFHDPPRPFHRAPNKQDTDVILESGMTLSIQPSVRHETYTIRFEDDIVLTPQGAELMTTLPKEMI
jgi:Xaa-Pro aminopeptidase